MPKFHIHTSTKDEDRVPEIMQIIEAYKVAHRPMTQLVALHELLKIAERIAQSENVQGAPLHGKQHRTLPRIDRPEDGGR